MTANCIRMAAWASPWMLWALAAGAASISAAESKTPAVGPRAPVGPDAPWSDLDKELFAARIPVEGRTAAGVQEAIQRAAAAGLPVVFLPAGEYVFETTVRVPEGFTVLGEGSQTLVRAGTRRTMLFDARGDNLRFTRMKLQGADTSPSDTNDTYGINVGGRLNVRIDHCELFGFSYATNFSSEATAQVDHCSIHHNLREGLGYGVAIYSGAYVLMTDNEFSQNRHSIATNGNLDWSSPPRVGIYLHRPGRKTHWEFIRNHVHDDDQTTYQLAAVDTHPGMDGTFVVEGNIFENLRNPIGIRDGSGLICANLFRNIWTAKTFRQRVAISIAYGTHNGIPVEDAMPHDIQVAENTFLDLDAHLYFKYSLGRAENITIEGQLVPETRAGRDPPPAIPWLQEMGVDGVLNWPEWRPRSFGFGGVEGTVTDGAGRLVAEAKVSVGEREAATDAAGRFRFPEVAEAARFAVVMKPGYDPEIVGLRVQPGQDTVVNVVLNEQR
ncbi:MAG: carboxypeptidase regulatory-like domain-containing protein [Acidobacteriota bacterium]|mgnify:CR=1 FL=1